MNESLDPVQIENDEAGVPAASTRGMILCSAGVVAAMFGVSAWAWGQIPEGHKIPVHWGINGQPDRWGGRFEGLLLMPMIAISLTVLLAVLPRFEPRALNLAQSRKAYKAIWISTLVFLAMLHFTLVRIALGASDQLINKIIPLGVGGLFLVIGNFMGKMRSNYIMGIRTPWTLSSEASWNKTHRLGGRLFILLGIFIAAGAVTGVNVAWVAGLIGGIFAVVIVLFVYSYRVWKADPNKIPGPSR